MTSVEFRPWPKIARLNREITITEKIDGTNACLIVTADGDVLAQSRTRLITPSNDNHGLAVWAYENHDALADDLGPGYHFGEWWGSGINRGYGLLKGEKRFSLFNTHRWDHPEAFTVPGLGVVPVLWQGLFSQTQIDWCLADLDRDGSVASPGFMNPEGVVVYHRAANQMFKVTIKGDEAPKGSAEVR